MAVSYFKRYRMEVDLAALPPKAPRMPKGYRLLAWEPSLLAAHAEAKYLSFREEIDASVFPCFGDRDGCLRLMREISHRDGFLPEATWLAVYESTGASTSPYCGTVQGIRDGSGMGAIQNLGITPSHRGQGLGTRLMIAALDGFRLAGLRHVFLDVTAQNEPAIRLYEQMGYRKVRTVYKAAEVAYT